MGLRKLLFVFFAAASTLAAQQPQTPNAPIYAENARYDNGVGHGYWPQAGSALTLNIAPGRVRCGNTMANYAGGTLTMANNTTNYVYLDATASCVPATNTTGYISTMASIATVVTASGVITTVTDDRQTPEFKNGATALGTVTSVGQTVPSWLSVSGSPVTASGTLATTPATGQTSHQVIGTCGTATTFTPCALVEGDLPAATVFNDQNATFGAHTYDFSGVTLMKARVGAGLTASANGDFGYDTTNNNWHAYVNGIDTLLVPLASGFVSGHCGQPTSSGGSWTIVDAGGACGTTSGTVTGTGTSPKIATWSSSSGIGSIGTPTLCSTGQAPTGIDANGNATGCATTGGGGNTITVTNNGAGTTLNQLVTLTGAPSTAKNLPSWGGSGLNIQGGAVGICTAGCGTTGSATITTSGLLSCVFDASTVANDYVKISATGAGKCADGGTSASALAGQIIGRVLSTNASAGTYLIDLFGSEITTNATSMIFSTPNQSPLGGAPIATITQTNSSYSCCAWWKYVANTGHIVNEIDQNWSLILGHDVNSSSTQGVGFAMTVQTNDGRPMKVNTSSDFNVVDMTSSDNWGFIGASYGMDQDALIPHGFARLNTNGVSVTRGHYVQNSLSNSTQFGDGGASWPFIGDIAGRTVQTSTAPIACIGCVPVRGGAFGVGLNNSTQTGNLTAVTLQGATFPDGVNQMFRATIYAVCTASVATGTVQINLGFTDEVQAQTPNSVTAPGGPGSLSCATSGTAVSWTYSFYAATGTAITYSTTTANSPQYKIRARLESLTN